MGPIAREFWQKHRDARARIWNPPNAKVDVHEPPPRRSDPVAMPVTVGRIQRMTAAHFGVPLNLVLSPWRGHEVMTARFIGILLARMMTKTSIAQLADDFQRDRTSIKNALVGARRMLRRDPELAEKVRELRRKISGEVPA